MKRQNFTQRERPRHLFILLVHFPNDCNKPEPGAKVFFWVSARVGAGAQRFGPSRHVRQGAGLEVKELRLKLEPL